MTGACHWVICEMLWLIFTSSARILPSRSRSPFRSQLKNSLGIGQCAWRATQSQHPGTVVVATGTALCNYLVVDLLHRALQLAGLPSYHANKQMQYLNGTGPDLL